MSDFKVECPLCAVLWVVVLDPTRPEEVWDLNVDKLLACRGRDPTRHLDLYETAARIAIKAARQMLERDFEVLDPRGIAGSCLIKVLKRCREVRVAYPFGLLRRRGLQEG